VIYTFDLPDALSGIFLSEGLDRANHVELSQENRLTAHPQNAGNYDRSASTDGIR
jgi:hypothetical protein